MEWKIMRNKVVNRINYKNKYQFLICEAAKSKA